MPAHAHAHSDTRVSILTRFALNCSLSKWQEYGDQAISLPYFPEGGCLTAESGLVGESRIIGSKCRGNFPVYQTQQWNLRGHDI